MSNRRYGNELAHLHDVTEMETLTSYGLRLKIFSEVIGVLEPYPVSKHNQHGLQLPSLYEEVKFYVQILVTQLSETKLFSTQPSSLPPINLDEQPYATNLWQTLYQWNNLTPVSSKQDTFFKLPIFSTPRKLQQAASLFGFDCKNVKGDGKCFFHAVFDQCQFLKLYTNLTVDELIQQSIHHLLTQWPSYQTVLHCDIDSLIQGLQTGAVWADEPVILALARSLKLTMVIIRDDHASPHVIKIKNSSGTLYLGYEVGVHYQSLIPNVAIKPQKNIQCEIDKAPFDQMIQRIPVVMQSVFMPSPKKPEKKLLSEPTLHLGCN
jgi:hypothetical protein